MYSDDYIITESLQEREARLLGIDPTNWLVPPDRRFSQPPRSGRRAVPQSISERADTQHRVRFLRQQLLVSHVRQTRRVARDGAIQPAQQVQTDRR